ncbi:HAL protein kinase [Puccinia graminis f. sp. tritici CRL 75-36-700-3]|uniref:non-specific serine/threonine protein kinase n=1 Tax=Puccinia graminis f. sp. tritici (strain CRL 75-36-700-3 / race SCCL) TaxID=418459 RepID=E3KBB8_PUCGT|nr:HAL protein kinase [Puccinia graminis f. sp. tritici CRL 75-36-700-3]EFP81631.2 HAL protein kinase [Puccinia graminis f. sp. tritici CRL 75-36-700-3]
MLTQLNLTRPSNDHHHHHQHRQHHPSQQQPQKLYMPSPSRAAVTRSHQKQQQPRSNSHQPLKNNNPVPTNPPNYSKPHRASTPRPINNPSQPHQQQQPSDSAKPLYSIQSEKQHSLPEPIMIPQLADQANLDSLHQQLFLNQAHQISSPFASHHQARQLPPPAQNTPSYQPTAQPPELKPNHQPSTPHCFHLSTPNPFTPLADIPFPNSPTRSSTPSLSSPSTSSQNFQAHSHPDHSPPVGGQEEEEEEQEQEQENGQVLGSYRSIADTQQLNPITRPTRANIQHSLSTPHLPYLAPDLSPQALPLLPLPTSHTKLSAANKAQPQSNQQTPPQFIFENPTLIRARNQSATRRPHDSRLTPEALANLPFDRKSLSNIHPSNPFNSNTNPLNELRRFLNNTFLSPTTTSARNQTASGSSGSAHSGTGTSPTPPNAAATTTTSTSCARPTSFFPGRASFSKKPSFSWPRRLASALVPRSWTCPPFLQTVNLQSAFFFHPFCSTAHRWAAQEYGKFAKSWAPGWRTSSQHHSLEYDLFSIVMTGKMSRKETYCVFKQIVSGVHYLHSIGIAHRDLKLDNCVMSRERRIKIIDFGAATIFKYPGAKKASGREVEEMWSSSGGEEEEEEEEVMKTTDVVGSDPYLAPEILIRDSQGNRACDPRLVDVWSVGIMFVCMILRRFPWRIADSRADLCFREFVRKTHPLKIASPLVVSSLGQQDRAFFGGERRHSSHLSELRPTEPRKREDQAGDEPVPPAKVRLGRAACPLVWEPSELAREDDELSEKDTLFRLLPKESRLTISRMLRVAVDQRIRFDQLLFDDHLAVPSSDHNTPSSKTPLDRVRDQQISAFNLTGLGWLNSIHTCLDHHSASSSSPDHEHVLVSSINSSKS